MTNPQLPIANAVWIGRQLGPIHAACLRSFLKQGHRVVLHCFDDIADVPTGVEIFDASRLMKTEEIVRHHESGSLTLASDKYRLRLLAENMGLYIDCDVFCLEPIEMKEYIFGWDACHAWTISDTYHDRNIYGLINNAVLLIPSSSELLNKMLIAADDPFFIPPWLSESRKRRRRLRKALSFPVPVTKQEWGVIGPKALTYYIRELGLTHHVADPDIFYFFRPETHRSLLNTQGLSVRDIVTPRSKAIHLCSSGGMPDKITPNSPLEEMLNI